MEPFYTTKGPGRGTGLDLPMVHRIAIQAKGRLNLKSEVGRGTTAELWLPLTETDVAATRAAQPAPGRALEGRPCVVLAVDDDALVLPNTVMILEDFGHKVFEATSGKEALAVLAQEPSVELVLTDMAMPHTSGIQLINVAQSLYPELRFLLATGYADASDDVLPTLLRIMKPFLQDDLARAVQDVGRNGFAERGVSRARHGWATGRSYPFGTAGARQPAGTSTKGNHHVATAYADDR